jgi:hypothetical protein
MSIYQLKAGRDSLGHNLIAIGKKVDQAGQSGAHEAALLFKAILTLL